MSTAPKQRFWNAPSVLYPAGAILLLGILFLFLNFRWVATQEVLDNQEKFRALGALAEQLGSRLSSYSVVMKAIDRLADKEVDAARKHSKAITYLAHQVPDLRAVSEDQCETGLDLQYRNNREVSRSWVFGGKDACAAVGVDRTMDVLLESLPEGAFDEVFVADGYGDGQVLFQSRRTHIRIDRLGPLVESAGAKPAAMWQRVTEAVKGPVKEVGRSHPDAGRIGAMSTLIGVPINGVDYYVYLVPLEVPLRAVPLAAKDAGPARYLLCGIVGRSQFRSRALSAHGGTVAWICLAAVVALTASWPLFRLTQMRATERVRRKTGLRLVLAALATTTLLTLLVFHGAYLLDDTETKDQLSRLRSVIDQNVAEEARRAMELLEAVPRDPAFAFTPDNAPDASPGICDPSHVVAAPQTRADVLSTRAFVYYSYPYFEGVSFADARGGQNVKWSVRRQTTPSINLCGFPSYFQTAHGRLWTLGGVRFRIDPLYSPNTGEYMAVISRPVDPAWVPGDAGEQLRVGSVVTPLSSLIDPVMPPDFGFAVVDQSGKVLFHSSSPKNQRENLLTVAEPSADLAAAIESRLRRSLVMRYEGQRVQMDIGPFTRIQGCPWSLIVFRRLAPREAMHLETIAHFFVFAILFAAVLFAAQMAVRLPEYPHAWMWPQRKMRGMYRLVTRAAIVMSIAAMIWIFHSEPGFILAAAVALPVASIAGGALALAGRRSLARWLTAALAAAAGIAILVEWVRSVEAGWRVETGIQLGCLASFLLAGMLVSSQRASRVLGTRYSPCLALLRIAIGHPAAPPGLHRIGRYFLRRACRIRPPRVESLYAIAGAGLVAMASLVPCVAFFKVAYDHHRLAFVKRSQILTMKSLAAREERIKAVYRNVVLPDEKDRSGAARWLFLRDRMEWRLDRYDRVLNEAAPDFRLPPRKEEYQGDSSGGHDHACETHLPLEAQLLSRLQLVSGPLAGSVRALHAEHHGQGSGWEWICEGSSRIRIQEPQRAADETARRHPLDGFRDRDPVLTARSMVSSVPELRNLNATAYVLLAAILVGAYWWIRHTIRHLFLLRFSCGAAWPPFDLVLGIVDRNLLLIAEPLAGSSRALASRTDVEVVDAAIFLQAGARVSLGDLPVLAIDHCGAVLHDPAALTRLLDFIERIARQATRHMLVIATFDPTAHLEAGPAVDEERIVTRQRWAKALAGFETARLISMSGAPANSAYLALWSAISRPERAVLHQLAHDGWANHKNYRAIESLVRRGIVVRDPVFRITDPGFRAFLLSDSGPVTPTEEASWKSHEETASWDWLRSVLLILGLALVATFLLLYQQDLWASMVTALGGIAGIGKLISNVKGLTKASSGESA